MQSAANSALSQHSGISGSVDTWVLTCARLRPVLSLERGAGHRKSRGCLFVVGARGWQSVSVLVSFCGPEESERAL